MFWPFFTALLLAALFAFALHDVVVKIESRKLSRTIASLILMLGLFVFIAMPITIVILKTIAKINEYSAIGFKNTEAYVWSEQMLHRATQYIMEWGASINLDLNSLPKPMDLLNDYAGTIGGAATNFLTQLPRIGLNLAVFIFALFFFLIESKKIRRFFSGLDILSETEISKITGVIKRSSFITIVASVSIAFIQALIISLAAVMVGYSDFFLIFIITFVFALVPVVGSAPPALFLILVAFFQGNTGSGIVLIVAFLIATSSDNVIKAFVLNSGNDNIHPIVSLLALIGALLVYGAPGILLGPVLTQLAFNALPILKNVRSAGTSDEPADF